jgi:hypothetical protein
MVTKGGHPPPHHCHAKDALGHPLSTFPQGSLPGCPALGPYPLSCVSPCPQQKPGTRSVERKVLPWLEVSRVPARDRMDEAKPCGECMWNKTIYLMS